MGYVIRYARIGNARPVYMVTDTYGDQRGLAESVQDVERLTHRPKRSVQIACREAREEGESWHLS